MENFEPHHFQQPHHFQLFRHTSSSSDLQGPSTEVFFFYSRTNERISICHAVWEKDIVLNNQMSSYEITLKRIFKKDRAHEKYLRSQT